MCGRRVGLFRVLLLSGKEGGIPLHSKVLSDMAHQMNDEIWIYDENTSHELRITCNVRQ